MTRYRYRVDLMEDSPARAVWSGQFTALTFRGAERRACRILWRHVTGSAQYGYLWPLGPSGGLWPPVLLAQGARRRRSR